MAITSPTNQIIFDGRHYEAVEMTEELVREQCGTNPSAEFVAEAMWPAYLASFRRCRCGSRKRLKPVSAAAMRGQLDLHLDPVVVQ